MRAQSSGETQTGASLQPLPRGDYSCWVQVQSRRPRGAFGFEVPIEGVFCLYPSQDENNQSHLPRSNGSPHAFLGVSQTLVASFLIMIPAIPSNPAGVKLCSSYNLSFKRQTPLPLPPCHQMIFSSW